MVLVLGFRVSGIGFRVSGFGFRVSDVGCRVQGFGCRGEQYPRVARIPSGASISESSSLSGQSTWFKVWGLGFGV